MKTRHALLLLAFAPLFAARAEDPATNAAAEPLHGARFFLEKAGAWDGAAHDAAEARSPAAAREAAALEKLPPERAAALWTDLAGVAVADAAGPSPARPPQNWFALLLGRLPPASEWPVLSRSLDALAEARGGAAAPSPLLAALRVALHALADDRAGALDALVAGFPADLPQPEAPADDASLSKHERHLRWQARGRRIRDRVLWTTARGFLERDLSDAPPDLSLHLAALRASAAWMGTWDDGYLRLEFLSDLPLCLPAEQLDALVDKIVADPERWTPWAADHALEDAPGLLDRVQRRLVEKTADGVPPELRLAVSVFRERDGDIGVVHRSPAGLELLRRSLPHRMERVRADRPPAAPGEEPDHGERGLRDHRERVLAEDLRYLLGFAVESGDRAEADRLRGLLRELGARETDYWNPLVDPDALPDEPPDAPWDTDAWRSVAHACAAAGVLDRADAALERRLAAATWATNAALAAVARAEYAFWRAAASAPFAEATDALLALHEAEKRGKEAGLQTCSRAEWTSNALYDWFDAAEEVDGREPANRAAIERALPLCREWLEGRTLGPGTFCTDRFMLYPFVEQLVRTGRFAEAEERLWDSIGPWTENRDWNDEEDVVPLVEFYVRAGRPQDAIDIAEGFAGWSRREIPAGIDPLGADFAARALVRALRAVGRGAEADRIAAASGVAGPDDDWYRALDPAADPWERRKPELRVANLVSCGFDGEARRVAAAAGLPTPGKPRRRDGLVHHGNPFRPLDDWRETLRKNVDEAAAKPLLPRPPVFPAARVPVGDGGPALASVGRYGGPAREASDRRPDGVPERFAPLFDRPTLESMRYFGSPSPDVSDWAAALWRLLELSPLPASIPPADPATKASTNSLDSGVNFVDNSPHLAK